MYEEIIARHRPRGYRVRHTRRKDEIADKSRARLRRSPLLTTRDDRLKDMAETDFVKRTIYAPHVVDPFTLHTLLHEFGHVHLGHCNNAVDAPTHTEEWECEQWAISVMKMHGVPVPRIVYRGIRDYIRECIWLDEQAGHVIKSHIRRFAKL